MDHHKLPETLDAPAREFVLWLMEALGLQLHRIDGGYQIVVPPPAVEGAAASSHPLGSLQGRRFTFDASRVAEDATDASWEHATWHSPLMQAVLAQLPTGAEPLQAAAASQPASVHELAEHLFAQYQVDEGHMHLAGCSLEDRPFLRLSYLRTNPDPTLPQLVHCFGTSDGDLLDPSLPESLHLDRVVPWGRRPRRMDPALLGSWLEVTSRQFESQRAERDDLCLLAVTLVWCKYAEGKLTFSIGQRSAEIAFAGWGRLLAERRVLPPPYCCPWTGRCSYHLSATDDGRLTVAESVARCAQSSRRVLETDLETCAVTGRRVLPEYLSECPCTGQRVLMSVLETCQWCQQWVSPQALEHGRCVACRNLLPVARNDPAWLGRWTDYPKLRRLRRVKMAQTSSVQIVVGHTTWRRLLIVFERTGHDVLFMATTNRFSSTWRRMTPQERSAWLDETGGPVHPDS